MPNPDATERFGVGDVLAGKYRIERVLGRGGMGVVLEATHLLLEERVAVKLMLPEVLADQRVHARFFREAQLLARVRSEHVVRVRDIGELDTGEPYIVMEYLEGESLEERLEQVERLPSREVVDLVLEACEGLASAHRAGVIHRDIKPSNLFVTRAADGTPCLKLLDFGISKGAAAHDSTDPSLTSTQVSMGSPLNMSPEQMRSARDVDHRTDIWSLGVVLYRSLSGVHPFEAQSLMELCALVLESEPVVLTERVAALEPGLAEVIERCLKKAPEERFANVAELASALRPFASDEAATAAERCHRILFGADSTEPVRPPEVEPSVAVTSTSFERNRSVPIPSRRRSGWVLGGVVALVGILITGFALFPRPEQTTPRAAGGAPVAALPPERPATPSEPRDASLLASSLPQPSIVPTPSSPSSSPVPAVSSANRSRERLSTPKKGSTHKEPVDPYSLRK